MRYIFLSLLFLISCQSYDDGGLISKAESRLTAQPWVLKVYFLNDADATGNLVIQNLVETFETDGDYLISYTDDEGEDVSEPGSWEFSDNQTQIRVDGVSSIELTDATGTVSSSTLNILKLEKEELWFSFENGGDLHEFHFTAQ